MTSQGLVWKRKFTERHCRYSYWVQVFFPPVIISLRHFIFCLSERLLLWERKKICPSESSFNGASISHHDWRYPSQENPSRTSWTRQFTSSMHAEWKGTICDQKLYFNQKDELLITEFRHGAWKALGKVLSGVLARVIVIVDIVDYILRCKRATRP